MKGSGVRVPASALRVCRAFLIRFWRAPCSEVPDGYREALGFSQRSGSDMGANSGARPSVFARDHMHPEENPMFLRPAEAAALAGLSTRAIYRAIARGDLPASRLCSRLRI